MNISVFGRKIIYLVVLVAMVVPLYLLGQPSAGSGDPGGRLSEMRGQFNIAESDLGEISPASETMKLASLGLRGVAATLLWNKAHRYRVLHEWDRLKATLNNIALLQPHYDKVWEHQAHNLAYNVSIEFDDYRQRYEMVREGTEFLTRGVRQNRNAPRLIWYTGWFYGQKMGMSDEKRQFRKLFADDEVLHESLLNEGIDVESIDAIGPLGKPDNWLVGRLWLEHGYDLVKGGVKIRRQTPLNFYETGPKWRIMHGEAIESEGILDNRAEFAWTRARDDWENFGKRSIPTTSPFTIKLGQIDELKRQRQIKAEEFRELTGDTYTAAMQEKLNKLPEDLRAVYNKPASERTEAGKKAMKGIERSLRPDFAQVAKACDPSIRLRAISMVAEMDDLEARIRKTAGYRTQINFEYWLTLCMAEQEPQKVEARRLIYEAEALNAEAEIDKAEAKYLEAFEIWAKVYDRYPLLTIDDSAEDLYDSIRRYMALLDSQDLPEDFPLAALAQLMGRESVNKAELYAKLRAEQKQKIAAREDEEMDEQDTQSQENPEAKDQPEKESEPDSAKSDDDTPATDDEKEDDEKDSKETEPEQKSDANQDGDENANKDEDAAEKSESAEKPEDSSDTSEESASEETSNADPESDTGKQEDASGDDADSGDTPSEDDTPSEENE